MKKFIFNGIKTMLLFYVALFFIQFLLDSVLSMENACGNNTWSKVFKGEIKSDIVIFGSSRAEFQYNSEIIQEQTNVSTYNLGLEGEKYTTLKLRWDSYIKRNKTPKIVILDVDEQSLFYSNFLYNKKEYLPYFYSDEYMDFAKKNDKNFYFEKFVPFYKYRGLEVDVYKKITATMDNTICSESKLGFKPQNLKWQDKHDMNFQKLMIKDSIRKTYDTNELKKGFLVLNEIITDCNKRNIVVVMVWSPLYYKAKNYQLPFKNFVDKSLKELSQKENIYYINYTNDSLCFKKEYFYNNSHLNKSGTSVFSLKIGSIIKEYLNETH